MISNKMASLYHRTVVFNCFQPFIMAALTGFKNLNMTKSKWVEQESPDLGSDVNKFYQYQN